MTSRISTRAIVTFIMICAGAIAWNLQVADAMAQGGQQVKIPPTSDYQFRKDYAAVEEIKAKETDIQKRAEVLLNWVKANPESRAIPNAAFLYGEAVAVAMKAGDAQKALSMIQTFQGVAPKDTTLLTYQMESYAMTKNWPKTAEIAEKIYAGSPSLVLENQLAGIYLQMGNADKYVFYAEKVMAQVPIDKTYSMALQVAQIYAQKRNMEKAIEYFSKVMDVYGDKVPAGVKEADWNVTRSIAFGVLAADAYQKKDLPKAMELYDKVTRFNPKSEDAWYFIGMAKWQGKDQKGAIEPLAKAAVINGKTYSPKAKEYLEQLWKAEHNGSLDGLDAVLAKAKTDLGIV